MIKICLIVKIHIPAIQTNYRFSDINHDHRYYNDSEVEKHVRKIYTENLLPFLESTGTATIHSAKKIKTGISISGITLTLLQKYAPDAVDQLINLEQNSHIEILSEPLSHSIVAYTDKKSLTRQIDLHDKLIWSLFGKIPELFIIHSPVYLQQLLSTISSMGKKGIFSNLNQINEDSFRKLVLAKTKDEKMAPVIPINYKLSELLQKIDFNPFLKSTTEFSRYVVKRFKNTVPDNNPVNVVYNPAATKSLYPLSRAVTWKRVLSDLLADNGIIFVSPSESFKSNSVAVAGNNLMNNIIYRSKLSDEWLKNKFQKAAFEKQLRVNTLIQTETRKNMEKEWNILQDMEYLYYMNRKFDKQNSEFNISPFPTAEEAYINYMNVLDDFLDRLSEKKVMFKKVSKSSTVVK